MKERIIRAVYDADTITVYQAFRKDIVLSAVANQTFLTPPFKRRRMTWIKPSFLWMMYRSGWATKENQEHVLAIKIKRSGFEWALANSCLSHFHPDFHASENVWKEGIKNTEVRIHWDPEKDIFLKPLDYRSIQIGLTGIAVDKYVDEWIVGIEDITAFCHHTHQLVSENKIDEAKKLLPIEAIYPLPTDIAARINLG